MKLFIEKENRHAELNFSGTGLELLKQLGINPENVLLIKNGEVVSESESLNDSDIVALLSVISGG